MSNICKTIMDIAFKSIKTFVVGLRVFMLTMGCPYGNIRR